MIRGYSTLMCRSLPPEQAAALALAAGLRGIELRTDDSGRIAGLGTEDVPRLRDAFRALRITDIASSCTITDGNADAAASGRAAVLLAEAVGSGAVRVFADAPDRSAPVPDRRAMKQLKELCAFAGDHGVRIWLETHSAFSTGCSFLPILSEADCPELGILWDVIHSVECGEGPEETVRLIGDRIEHIHLKDGIYAGVGRQWSLCALGMGQLPLRKALAALRRIGFSGCLSLEWESAWHPELDRLYPDQAALLLAYGDWLDRAEE